MSPIKFFVWFVFVLITSFFGGGIFAQPPGEVDVAVHGVVRISTSHFVYSYSSPWKQPALEHSGGTGFIIKGNRIVTNAHVVSQANTIRVQRPNQRTDFPARVAFIAHDCDLAVLEVLDPAFFKGAIPLQIGEPPRLNSPLVVIGFPIGGTNVSITRGIVSRLGMDNYSHSMVDWHKVIQVDAAINPGNSGGPALQNGKVIGVAFQVYRQGQNLGYLIPPEVLRKFLTDIKDKKYDGYIDFGTMEVNTTNATMRRALGIPESGQGIRFPDTGVFIYNIIPGSSAHGHLKAGDVLLSVNGRRITHRGSVEIDGQMQSYSELIDNLSPGSPIKTEIWRNRKLVKLSFPAKKTNLYHFQRRNYDSPPPYYIVGGLLFQPVNANLFRTYARKWAAVGQSEILYRYRYFLNRNLHQGSRVDVVLTRRLGDPVNVYSDQHLFGIVASVNGRSVRDFHEFAALVEGALTKESYLVIRFRGKQVPMVYRTADLRVANPRVLNRYGIRRRGLLGVKAR